MIMVDSWKILLYVALHAESVDRNTEDSQVKKDDLVALHAESVDRNPS